MAKNESISLKDLQSFIAILTPKPLAPLAPLDYTKGSEGAFGMAKDIQYMQIDIREIKATLEKVVNTHVTKTEFNDHVVIDDKRHQYLDGALDKFDGRIRTNEAGITAVDGKVEIVKGQLKSWGLAFTGAIAIVQIALHFL